MRSYYIPVILLCLSNVVFWFKGNSKELFNIDWTPFRWWLTTSLLTNYMTLIAWWKLIELGDVWKAGVIWGMCSITVDLMLNTAFFGFSWKGVIALCLCALAAIIAHS